MGLFDRLAKGAQGQQSGQQPDPRQGYQQMMQDPAGFFAPLGLNIPTGMSDPQEIINYLRSSGQLPDNMFSTAMNLFNRRPR